MRARLETITSAALAALCIAAACGGGTASTPHHADPGADLADAQDETAQGGADAGPEAAADAGPEAAADADAAAVFEPFAFRTTAPDPLTERLCPAAADPDAQAETTFVDCALEGEDFAPADVAPKDELVVLTYNLERGFEVDGQLDWLLSHPDAPAADVLLISEADRGCARTDRRHVTRELAQALQMQYVFATEFVELGRSGRPEATTDVCEHGNAVLSRYPLGNVRQLRHAVQHSWYCPPGGACDEPRLGGRVAVVADVRVGARVLRAYSVHLESTIDAAELEDLVSAHQARELADDGLASPHPVVVAGDFNAPRLFWDLQVGTAEDPIVAAFVSRGYADAHAALPYEARITHPPGLVLDLVFARGAATSAPGICPEATCGGLSDHLPVWATVALGE